MGTPSFCIVCDEVVIANVVLTSKIMPVSGIVRLFCPKCGKCSAIPAGPFGTDEGNALAAAHGRFWEGPPWNGPAQTFADSVYAALNLWPRGPLLTILHELEAIEAEPTQNAVSEALARAEPVEEKKLRWYNEPLPSPEIRAWVAWFIRVVIELWIKSQMH
jgi:hypothetical protein